MMYRHPFIVATLFAVPFCVAAALPILGPLIAMIMLTMRWHWTVLDASHKSSLLQHLFFLLTAPLALAGSLIASSFFVDALIHFGFQPWSILVQLQSWWAGIAIPLARSIFVAITQAHDAINVMLGISTRWLPDEWWLPGILSSDPARAAWIVLPALAFLLVLMIAIWDHLCIRLAVRSHIQAQLEAEQKLADFNAAVKAEIRIAQAHTHGQGPAVSSGILS
jgi:hypothetical protein